MPTPQTVDAAIVDAEFLTTRVTITNHTTYRSGAAVLAGAGPATSWAVERPWPWNAATTTDVVGTTWSVDSTTTTWTTDDATGDLVRDFPILYWTAGDVLDVRVGNEPVEPVAPDLVPPAVRVRSRAMRRQLGDAERRAEELLETCLGRQAVRDWRAYGAVRVVGSLGGVYDVGPQHSGGWSGQVVQILPLGGVLRWCCHATMRELPVLDQVVSLAMQIRHDEVGFQRTANCHGAGDEAFARRAHARRTFRDRAAA